MNFACRFPRRPSLGAALAAVAVIFVYLSGHSAWSQTSRTIKVVVPFAAGEGKLNWAYRGTSEPLAHRHYDTFELPEAPHCLLPDRPRRGAHSRAGYFA